MSACSAKAKQTARGIESDAHDRRAQLHHDKAPTTHVDCTHTLPGLCLARTKLFL